MKLAVVTVTFNSASVLKEFLACCEDQKFQDYVLVVVDNNSQDESLRIVNEFAGTFNLKIISLPENLGVAEGNNLGIQYGLEQGCEFSLILNNDVVFSSAFFGDLVREMEANPQASVIVPKINFHSPDDMIWYGGGKFVFYAGPLTWHLNEGKLDKDCPAQKPFFVSYAPTCAMLVRASVFGDIGMMDAKYFVYWDDSDFCFRLLRSGNRILYIPSILMFHKVSSLTGGGKSPFSIKMYSRNQVYFVRKHFNVFARGYYYCTIFAMNLLRLANGKDNFEEFRLRVKSFFLGFGIIAKR